MRIPAWLALFFLLAFAITTTAQARLGESEAQIIQRFGQPFARQHLKWCDKDDFSANGFTIEVTLLNGQSVGESYRDTQGTLNDEQIYDLLQANSQGAEWHEVAKSDLPKDYAHPGKRVWKRPNESTAVSYGYSIEFKSIDLIMAEEAANKPSPAPSTAGF